MNLTFQLKPADDYNEPRSININLISGSAIFSSVKGICWSSSDRKYNHDDKNNYNDYNCCYCCYA